jgi:hypothetical protein
VAAEPLLLRELIGRHQLKFLAFARPAIEIIPAIACRRNQHVFKALTVRIAVESGVLPNRAQDRARTELIAVGQAKSDAVLVQII